MIDLKTYGYLDNQPHAQDLLPCRIILQHRERYQVICQQGEVPAVLTGSFYHQAQEREGFPTVGDFALIRYNESGDSGIVSLLPRKSKFSRTDFSGHGERFGKHALEQLVAANFDEVFILTSLNHDFSVSRIARYLSAAWQSGGQPVVILTKADLMEDYRESLRAVESAAPGVPVHVVSSQTGMGLEHLRQRLAPGKTIVFLGMSGVGKSSLLNALAGEEVMAVSEIREDDSRGRHTTTHRQLFRLPSGALIIDTPGMRELGLWGADQGIRATFADVEELQKACRFRNCSHGEEPGCAVRAALEAGTLPQGQWDRYLSQTREAAYVENKSEYLRKKQERHKAISRYIKDKKKGGEL